MKPLDDQLREALRRRDPGPEFTARVLARAAAAPRKRESVWRRFPAALGGMNLRWATAALACLLVVAGGIGYHERQVRIQGEAAKEQLVRALKIASSKLNHAREKVRELNVPRGES